MNRAHRRAEEAKAKMQRNAERVREVVDAGNEAANAADFFKSLLFASAREHGRIRVRAEHLAALSEDDRVDFIRQPNGDVIVQYSGAR